MFPSRFARTAGLAAAFFALALLVGPLAGQDAKAPAPAPAKDDKKEAKKAKSKLKITVPLEDAVLQIQGKPTKLTGTVREFETPDLDAGKRYEYAFSVVWQPNNYTTITRARTTEFTAGEDVVFDLAQEDKKLPDKVVIRWVPTPDDIVAKMIELGGVKAGDVAYEPGPGDGRVLIAAVKAGAKKAVGIEIDKEKARESTEAVKKAGLADKVEIREGDALKVADYGEASVVFLYMGNEFNGVIRPVLEKALKPGSRIVSHRFTMGDWMADKTLDVQGTDGEEYKLHLWTVKEKK